MNGGGNLKNFESEYKKNRNEYYRKFIEKNNGRNVPPYEIIAFNRELRKNNANIRKLEIIMNSNGAKYINKNYLYGILKNAIENKKNKVAETLIKMFVLHRMGNNNLNTLLKLAKEKNSSSKVINSLQTRINVKFVNKINEMSNSELQNKLPKMTNKNKQLIKKYANKRIIELNKRNYIKNFMNRYYTNSYIVK